MNCVWDKVGEAFLRTLTTTTCYVFDETLLQDVTTKYAAVITKSIPKVSSTVSLRSRIKTRPSKLAPSTEIKGQTLSAAVEPSNPRMVKTNWLGSKLIDLDKNLANVTRLEKCQQGFMEMWIGFGQRELSTGPSGLP